MVVVLVIEGVVGREYVREGVVIGAHAMYDAVWRYFGGTFLFLVGIR